jgi:hypothetical protein
MPNVVCPRCDLHFDTDDRCPEMRGMGRCMASAGHAGWHWTDVGAGDGSVLIWTGLHQRRSCAARLGENDRWCEMEPGHEGWHRHRGTSFSDPIEEPDVQPA